jgi:hypothetical protein
MTRKRWTNLFADSFYPKKERISRRGDWFNLKRTILKRLRMKSASRQD